MRVPAQKIHRERYEWSGAHISIDRHLRHSKTKSLEPAKLMVREVRKAAQAQRLAHKAEILQHHPLLYRNEFRYELFYLPHSGDAAEMRIIFQMTTAAARELPEARGEKMISFVQ